MLAAAVLVPLLGALFFAVAPFRNASLARALGGFVASVPWVLLVLSWLRFDPEGPLFQQIVELPWIPQLGAAFRLGVDGIALVIATLTALLVTGAIVYPTDLRGSAPRYVAWMLFLETVTLGFFLALDLLLFYVFFDLSLVGMYFLIALWGHEDRERAALKFVLFTFAGSLVMLLGLLSLVLATDPLSFDMRVLIAEQPLAGAGLRASLTLGAILFGLVVKTPLVPFHTWLPVAHVEAPAPVSMILAGVLLKMGTFGMLRVAYAMLQETFRHYALVLGILALVSIVYGAFVAFGQRHLKRRIAYTSLTHMGYTVLGISMAFAPGASLEPARRLALTGAALEMVAHGLITGALFLLAGSIWQRGESFEMDDYGGLHSRAPRLTIAFVIAAFGSLGLPGLAGFVAELQIFAGAIAIHPWLAGLALVGVLVTAALFLQLLQVVFYGERSDRSESVTDLGLVEAIVLAVLLVLVIVIGVFPAFVVDVIDASSSIYIRMP